MYQLTGPAGAAGELEAFRFALAQVLHVGQIQLAPSGEKRLDASRYIADFCSRDAHGVGGAVSGWTVVSHTYASCTRFTAVASATQRDARSANSDSNLFFVGG